MIGDLDWFFFKVFGFFQHAGAVVGIHPVLQMLVGIVSKDGNVFVGFTARCRSDHLQPQKPRVV